jgi:hypothetical protein
MFMVKSVVSIWYANKVAVQQQLEKATLGQLRQNQYFDSQGAAISTYRRL